MKVDFFTKTIEETLQEVASDSKLGLTTSEVEKRLEEDGENKLEGGKQKSTFQIFIDQFKDFLVVILIVAAAISITMSIIQGENILEGIIIIAIVIINAVLGVYQESKASNALKALEEMSSPQTKVIRNGQIEIINSNLIVKGDIVVLESGDYVPTDVRLISSINLKIDESALTGESVSVEKFADVIVDSDSQIGDRINSGYMGTIVTYGRGHAVAIGTGMNTEMGKIASMLNVDEEGLTPLQELLNAFSKGLGILSLVVCAVIFFIGIFFLQMDIFEMFMTAVALAVAAIPEGLTIVVTVILSIGMQRMVKKNAIIKKLSAVETLGSTTVICSDKTGTLTQNKMTIVKINDSFNTLDVEGTGYAKNGKIIMDGKYTKNIDLLIEGAVLCNDAIFIEDDSSIIGDPTEGALVVLGAKMDIDSKEINEKYPRIDEIPFDSTRKLMSTLHHKDGKAFMYTKGAPDELLSRVKYIYKDGEVIELSDKERDEIEKTNEDYARDALRVLAVAYKERDIEDKSKLDENDLTFIGLLCMIDPPREEAKDAIAVCHKAGINVKMITGDHKITALAIAKNLGITDKDVAVTGKEISNMSDEELAEKVKTTNVFARVSPEHKVRLVDAVKSNNNICAMTGDGVNDAPSLKRADIGVAMGITGTDVSKEAADMILTDDNFASIVSAVEEGRTIYSNIRKVISYLISCNVGEILIIFFAMILQIFLKDDNIPTVPLVTVQLLTINLVTDAFPAFALGMEEKEKGIMNKKPRDPNASLIDKKMGTSIIFQSLGLAIGCLASFLVGAYYAGPEYATTFTFVTLVIGELLRSYSARSEDVTILKMKIFSNSYLNKSVLFSLIFLLLTIYVPALNPIFETQRLSLPHLGIAVVFSVVPIIFGELTKLYTRTLTK